MKRGLGSCVALALLVSSVACGSDSAGADGAAAPSDGGRGNAPSGGEMPPLAGNAGAGGRPPEREVESRYLAPVATGKYLWTANPLSGRVALIDVTKLEVTLETAGNAPRQVVGLPAVDGRVGALVLNERSDDATLFRLDEDGRPVKSGPFRTHADANAWSVSPSGRWAIAWTDAALRDRPDPLETFQDITLFSLEPGDERVLPLSVGARPSAFVFAADEAHAYAVTDEGISVITLGADPAVTALVVLSDDPLADPAARDVSFAPDGSYAVVRTEGRSDFGIVALPQGDRTVVTLEGVITDVDLAPEGEVAFAVLGFDSRVVKIPVDAADEDPATFERLDLGDAHAVGSIALNADGSRAVVYSTVADSTRVSLIDATDFTTSTPVRRHELIAPIRAVFPAPDARFAVAFQGPAAGSDKAGGFSVLSLEEPRSPRIVATDAEPVQIAFAPDAPSALVTVRSDARRAFGAYLVDLVQQRVDFVALASPPESAGVVVEARRAYVAQAHPEGRITFVSTQDQSVQTLTGFELAARIRSH